MILFSGIFAFSSNALLFAIKLYVGLSSNSISIYSDGINNLFDSLSGVLAVLCFVWAVKLQDKEEKRVIMRIEALSSFVMSLAVSFTALSFMYNSFERLMYPTPIWYTEKYFVAIFSTTLAKVIMLFVFRALKKKTASPVVEVMAFDSILDVFVSAVTLLSLMLAKNGTYSADAFIGVFISAVMIVGAVKLVTASVKKIIFDKEEAGNCEEENETEREKN